MIRNVPGRPSSRRTTASVLAAAGVATGILLLLNLPLSLFVWFPPGEYQRALVPVPESILFLWVLYGLGLGTGGRRNRPAGALFGALFGVLLGLSGAEAFFRYFYARSFAVRGDLPMVRGALLLFFGEIGPIVDVLTPLTITGIMMLLAVTGWLVLRAMSSVLAIVRPTFGVIAAVSLIGIVPALFIGPPPSITATVVSAAYEAGVPAFSPPSDSGDLSDGEFPAAGSDGQREISSTDDSPGGVVADEGSYRLPGLKDRDVYVFLVEAYGYASVSRPELAEQINPARDRLEEALSEAGYGVVTTYLGSPVAGGYSWLADATLLTGQWIDSQERFLQLYGAEVPSLGGFLYDAGYYTYTVRPGTVHEPWPEGWDLFRFEESLIAYGGSFNYRGPRFSYVSVPDQYAIWTGQRRIGELTAPGGEAEDRPFFAYFQLVSSHTPFTAVPPLISSWDDLEDGEIFNRRSDEILRFDNSWTGGTELIEGYTAAISYVFSVLADYVKNVMDHSRDPLIVIVGDHEPQRPIRSPRSELSVPVHIATRDEEILRCLTSRGYDRGIRPTQPPPHQRLTTLFPTIVEIADTCR